MILHAYNCELSEIDLSEFVAVLEIERPEIFVNVIEDFTNATSPAKEVAIEGEKGLLKASDIFCIHDFVSFDLTSRQLIGKIYKYFDEIVRNDLRLKLSLEEKISELRNIIESMARFSAADFYCSEEIDYKEIFSALGLAPLCLFSDPEQKLIQFLNLCSELKLCKTLVLVQPKTYISAEKLQEVYRCALANRIGLIVIDCVCRKTTLPYEKKICILNDFSDIII